jgi:FKBP-type peptidyl-prolyl cis-trans isomerase (trigger factor)
MPQTKNFTITKVDMLPDSEALITGEISLPFLVECRKEAVKNLNENASLPGFRPGHIPEDVLVKNIGEMRILEEAAEIAIAKEYSEIITDAKIDAIGRPHISITKLAPGVPLEYKIEVAVRPEFTLPDYKKIVSKVLSEEKKEDLEVTEKEIQDVIEELNKREIKPELKEEEKLEDLVKESLTREKEIKNKETRRLSIIENLVKETQIAIPKALLEGEKSKMLAQFRGDVENMGLKWNEYLEKVNKTEETIRDEWKDQALSRVKAELILAKIADTEKVEPTPAEVEHETAHLLSHYPGTDPLSAKVYVYGQMRNQKVFEFLEGLK